MIQGRNRAHALVEYARQKRRHTDLPLPTARTRRRRWFPGLDFTGQVVQQAQDLEVTVVAERSRDGRGPSAYPEDEAGSLMHSGYVSVLPETTVEEALAEIRRQVARVEMIFYVYAVDSAQHLQGVASFRELLAAERSKTSAM